MAEEGTPVPTTPVEEASTVAPEESKRPSITKRASTMSRVKLADQDGDKRRSSTPRRSTLGEKGILRRTSDRPSKARIAVGSTVSIRRGSVMGDYAGGVKVLRYMNTYKLDSDNPFNVEKVEKILKDVLVETLDELSYDADKCSKQAKWASSAIRARVKEFEYDRYRFVILVTIGEKRYHDMSVVVRFLWDIERDKYAIFVHENMHVFATAMCFGVYYE